MACLLLITAPAFGQAEGEPDAGGGVEANVRYLLPPTGQVEPDWTAAQKQRGYVVYSDNYNHAIWPKQIPSQAQIVDSVSCRMSRNEYEPIQIGVFGVGNSKPLQQVKAVVDIDLPAEVRFVKYIKRAPKAKDLKHLGETLVPYQLRLGDTHASIEPGHSGAFWITLHASDDAAPGKHTGTITISVEGKTDLKLALTAEVLPMRLPRADITFGMYHYRINAQMRDETYAEKIQRDMAAHGIVSSTLYGMQPIRYEHGRLIFPSQTESRLHDWIDRGMVHVDRSIMLLDYQLVNWHSGNVNDGYTAKQKQDIARQYIAYARAQGFPEILAYLTDEPTLSQPPSYFTWAAGWKKTPMRTVAALSGKAAAGFGHLHDVWVVHTGQITPQAVREAWRQGAEVWAYTFSMGAYNFHSNRYMDGLYTWALGLRGNFQWSYFHADRYVELEEQGPDPLVSWEGRREGIDDYRYLMVLETLADRAAADNEAATEAKAWLAELRAAVDLTFFHGFGGGSRVDGPFCYPAPQLELEDYDRIRAKAADYCMKLGANKLKRFAPTPYVRSGAAKWEAQPFERASLETCIAALADADVQVRRAAAASLADRGEAALPANKALQALLTDPDVRLVAARALRAIGPKASGAADAIAVMFDDQDAFVRMTATMALGGLGEQSIEGLRRALRDIDPQVVRIAGQSIRDLGPAAAPAVPDIIPLIGHEIDAIRRAAFAAVEGIGPGAAPALDALIKEFLRQEGRNEYIARAIGAIGPDAKAAVPVLEQERDGIYWTVAMNGALFRIRGDKADLDALVEQLRNPGDRYTRERVCNELEKLGKDAAAVADDVRAFLKDQGDDFAKKHVAMAASLNRYLEKTR